MLNTNLRDLFLAVNATTPLNREEGTLLDASNAVLLDKDKGETVYIIGDEGETIEAYKLGSQVVVPLAVYMSEALRGGPEVTVRLADMPTTDLQVEMAIQERLAAILESVSTRGGTELPSPVPLDDVFTVLAERLRPRTLRAVLCNEVTARLIEGFAGDVKVYAFNAFLEGQIIGVADPEYTGLVIMDRRPRSDDPPLQPGSVERTLLRAGIIAQQRGVTSVIGQP